MFSIETWGFHKRNQFQSWGQVAQASDAQTAITIAMAEDSPVRVFDPDKNLLLERGMDIDRTRL